MAAAVRVPEPEAAAGSVSAGAGVAVSAPEPDRVTLTVVLDGTVGRRFTLSKIVVPDPDVTYPDPSSTAIDVTGKRLATDAVVNVFQVDPSGDVSQVIVPPDSLIRKKRWLVALYVTAVPT